MRNADDFLAHYGVKGMKWGVRRKKSTTQTSNDTSTAKKPYITKDNASKRAIQAAGLAYAATFMYNAGKIAIPILISSAVEKKRAANGAKFAAQLFAETRGITNYKTVVL